MAAVADGYEGRHGAPGPPELTAIVRSAALEAAACFEAISRDELVMGRIAEAGMLLAACLAGTGKVITCGNGGSMCDAIHLAEELSGRFRADRRAFAALALSDPGHLTCVGNDLGYDEVFARGIEALGQPGDVLVAFTTSGTSPNVLPRSPRLGSATWSPSPLPVVPELPLSARPPSRSPPPAGAGLTAYRNCTALSSIPSSSWSNDWWTPTRRRRTAMVKGDDFRESGWSPSRTGSVVGPRPPSR